MNSLVVVNICIVLLHILILVNLTTAISGKYKNNQNYILDYLMNFKFQKILYYSFLLFQLIYLPTYYDRILILLHLEILKINSKLFILCCFEYN